MRTSFFLALVLSCMGLVVASHPVWAQAIGSPTPSPTPMEAPKTAPPELTIGVFYDAKKQTNPTFLLWGTGEALGQITVSIFPDNVGGTTMVDNVGRWQWTTPKSLSNGQKQLTIAITNEKGGQTVKTDTFTVVGAFQFPTAAVLFTLAIALVVGIYIWMQIKHPGTSRYPASPDTNQHPASSETDQHSTSPPNMPLPPDNPPASPPSKETP
jgi:hypothetical protein